MKKTLIIYSLLMIVGCDMSDDRQPNSPEFVPADKRGEFMRIPNYSMPVEHVEAFQKLGFSGYSVIPGERKHVVNGKKEFSYIVDGDIEISVDQLLSLAKMQPPSGRAQQYRTTVVANPGVYRIAAYGITGSLRVALNMAIANYVNENAGISFIVKYPEQYSSLQIYEMQWGQYADIQVSWANLDGPGGGVAGFPYSDGRPYGFINVDYETASNFGIDVAEHVLTHELGHCIGFRHTDYFDRSISGCLVDADHPADEGDAGVGAIHIPGTPAMPGADWYSIMLSCFSASETGEFSSYDIVALNELF